MVTMYRQFRDRHFLVQHIRDTLAFYHPRCIDTEHGGFFHYFRDDGSIADASTRHLVSSTRFIFNYAMAVRLFGDEEYLAAARHGIEFLRSRHRDPESGFYAWIVDRDGRILDGTRHCYGMAFVVLAYASALKAGIEEASAYLDEAFDVMEQHFWLQADGLYRDELGLDGTPSPYRGQNANMHSCEAMLAAFEASGQMRYLERAHTLALRVCCDLADHAGGLIWEHYDDNWEIDWSYNKDNPKHLFRPWGFQPGHQTEWAKLLLILERHRSEDWMLPHARRLFDTALAKAWDEEYGGICYGFDPAGEICDDDKYFWVQAESFAAAALLGKRSEEPAYWDWYDRIWDYSWRHLVDHRYGAWFRILDRQNRPYDDLKSPAGKTDYHTMGACYEVLNVLE